MYIVDIIPILILNYMMILINIQSKNTQHYLNAKIFVIIAVFRIYY